MCGEGSKKASLCWGGTNLCLRKFVSKAAYAM